MVILGIALLVTGAGLLIAEAHMMSHGLLGAGGVAALVAGAALAVGGSGGGALLVATVALLVGLVAATVMLYAVRGALTATRGRVRTGAEALVGRVGTVRREPHPLGQVFVDGALWQARPCWSGDEEALREGDTIVVERVQGLTLSVRRAEEWELDT